jgi:hypothetical protein
MLKGHYFTIIGGLYVSNEINTSGIKCSTNGQSVKLSYNQITYGTNPTIFAFFQMYYSALNATCYNVAYPLITKDLSISLNSDTQLEFPISEYIYVDVASSHVNIKLPYVNQTIGNVDVSKQTCRFRVRQMTGGYNLYFKTYSNSSHTDRTGGIMYDFQNAQQPSTWGTGAWYQEVHFYNGNWYFNRLS